MSKPDKDRLRRLITAQNMRTAMAGKLVPLKQTPPLDRVAIALDNLPPRTKQAFLLVRYDGLSFEQAAQVMQTRQWRVRRFVQRAFAQCQRAIHE